MSYKWLITRISNPLWSDWRQHFSKYAVNAVVLFTQLVQETKEAKEEIISFSVYHLYKVYFLQPILIILPLLAGYSYEFNK